MVQERNAQRPRALETRPLTARQVVASTLLGVDPPRLPSSHLVRAGELFGISEGTTRVAVSRMLAAGELRAEDGWYRLAGPLLLDRQARQAEGRHPRFLPWDGRWELLVVRAGSRSATDRGELRRAMRALHLAEAREGVWLRPANLDPDRFPSARSVARRWCLAFTTTLADDGPTPAEVAADLWDLTAWATHARALLDALADGERWLAEADGLRPAWELSAAVVRHLLSDPLLPAPLLPANWPGEPLRQAYDRFDLAFKARWRRDLVPAPDARGRAP